MKFHLGMNISNFWYNRLFWTRDENWISRTHKFHVYFQTKWKMTSSQALSKWTDDRLLNFIKCLQKSKSSMEFRNCASNTDNVKLHAFNIGNAFFKLSLGVEPQLSLLVFSWVEPKMLLKCCLLHIDMIIYIPVFI